MPRPRPAPHGDRSLPPGCRRIDDTAPLLGQARAIRDEASELPTPRRKLQMGLTEVCPTCGAKSEIVLTWRDVIEPPKGTHIGKAAEDTIKMGYRYMCFNDSIYRVDVAGDFEDTGLTAEDVR